MTPDLFDPLARKIRELKEKLNAVILVHNYQVPEIQDLGDYIGDSLGLAQQAAKTDADVIVFCGVHFMAETAKILNPNKVVLLPDKDAGCSLEESCPAQKLEALQKSNPNFYTIAYLDGSAPGLLAEHVDVFACSLGDNPIHYLGHVKMMGAVQPFLSGAISKTVNMPEEASVEEIELLLIESWRLGLKAVALYRDNCKVAQPMSAGSGASTSADGEAASMAADATEVVERVVEKIVAQPVREKLPRSRSSRTFEFRVADCKGFVTVGEYDDGRPGEIFVRVSKQGSTLAGIVDAFAVSLSHGLQYGVPLTAFVEAYVGMRFEPAGMTDDPDIRIATSLMDYLFRKLAIMYLDFEERAALGILSTDERTEPTLPGVVEQVTETVQGSDLPPDPPSVPSATELVAQLEIGIDDAPAEPKAEDRPAAPVTPAPTVRAAAADAPFCMTCGVPMQRAGACYVCSDCGTTSGCS